MPSVCASFAIVDKWWLPPLLLELLLELLLLELLLLLLLFVLFVLARTEAIGLAEPSVGKSPVVRRSNTLRVDLSLLLALLLLVLPLWPLMYCDCDDVLTCVEWHFFTLDLMVAFTGCCCVGR